MLLPCLVFCIKERFCVAGAYRRRSNLPHVMTQRLSIFNDEWNRDSTNSPKAPS